MAPEQSTRESDALLAALHSQRAHVLGAFDGLPDEALRRPVLPSGWTCLGLVQHLALDVERFWFRAVTAGESVDLKSGDAAWQVAPDVPAAEVFDLYRREAALADAVIAATSLDAAPVWWPPGLFDTPPPEDLRQIILGVITETACHAGHLDAARELIDKKTWLILT